MKLSPRPRLDWTRLTVRPPPRTAHTVMGGWVLKDLFGSRTFSAAEQREDAAVVQEAGERTVLSVVPVSVVLGSLNAHFPTVLISSASSGQDPLCQPIRGGALPASGPMGEFPRHLLHVFPKHHQKQPGGRGGRPSPSEPGASAGTRGRGGARGGYDHLLRWVVCHMTCGLTACAPCRRWWSSAAPSRCSATAPVQAWMGECSLPPLAVLCSSP